MVCVSCGRIKRFLAVTMGEGNVTLKLVSAYLQVSPYLRKTQTWSPRSLGKLGWRRAQCSEPRKQQW
uniref:Uncharacterized protein n=1 Tax=Vespula pensylvanica TaxID=30213 RepID=A0A834KXP0_VESPE|nr:hypothetical protein H0235_012890 [Vespula pensylvanica]